MSWRMDEYRAAILSLVSICAIIALLAVAIADRDRCPEPDASEAGVEECEP